MKKQIFTLLILIGLVGFSSKLFAQSTPVAPYEGATHTYVVDGLTNGDLVWMGVSASATGYDNVATGSTTWASMTQTPAAGGAVTNETASLEVTWGATSADASATFYVWIRIQDNIGCSTYRVLPVTPTERIDYVVDFNVLAVTIDDGDISEGDLDLIDGGTTIPTSGIMCSVPTGQDYIADDLTDNTMTDGNTYIYFRVNRTPSGTDPLVQSAWQFTPTGSFLPAIASGASWEIAPDGDVAFGPLTSGTEQNIAAGVNSIYIRALIPIQTVAEAVTLQISDGADAGGLETDANGVGANSATLNVSPVPTVGTFGSSF